MSDDYKKFNFKQASKNLLKRPIVQDEKWLTLTTSLKKLYLKIYKRPISVEVTMNDFAEKSEVASVFQYYVSARKGLILLDSNHMSKIVSLNSGGTGTGELETENIPPLSKKILQLYLVKLGELINSFENIVLNLKNDYYPIKLIESSNEFINVSRQLLIQVDGEMGPLFLY